MYTESLNVVSQCFKSTGVSFVTLYCGHRRLIHVERALHGYRPHHTDHDLSNYCDVLPTDCLTDVTGQYDWSACRGHRHCVQSLRHFNHTATDHDRQQCVDSQRLIYLQVKFFHFTDARWTKWSLLSLDECSQLDKIVSTGA